jgi:hypothetical protein
MTRIQLLCMRVLIITHSSFLFLSHVSHRTSSIWEGAAEGKVGNHIREEMRLLHASLLGLHRVNLACALLQSCMMLKWTSVKWPKGDK